MSSTPDNLAKTLITHGVKPSVQRIAILEYLQTHYTHPTVEEVYQGLNRQIPTLSKTTVYNTLRLLAEHNVALMITLDEHRVCYDGNTKPHVHFMCKKCGRIFDFMDEPMPMLESNHKMIDGNKVDEIQLYYKGVCAECQAKGKAGRAAV